MKHFKKTIFFFSCLSLITYAKENVNHIQRLGQSKPKQLLAGCEPSKSRADLDINNVRCPIWINGDMWWDLTGTALYEVPVGSGKNSLFAGAIWFGGKDGAGNLKVAAQTYRQSGSDFWPGPIDTTTTSISATQCVKYDKHFKITFAEVKNFHEEYQIKGNVSYVVPEIIKTWPTTGDPAFNEQRYLAPFFDRVGDGVYDIDDGDYPKYNVDGTLDPCDKGILLGDQTIWWVFNDVGNIHGETESLLPVGVEIQAQAFGFNTNDAINNMTFYRYKIINWSSSVLNETYFGSWVDPDLGNFLDDFVGCDVLRGLGYCYNGDSDDDGAVGYGLNPPAIGVDFFEGPLADPLDSLDNDRDGIVDEVGEQIIMSKFVYYNNNATLTGNPNSALQYYNYLDGKWKDNSPLYYGGTGYQTIGAPECNFMFPDDTDPANIGTNGTDPGFDWSENLPCQGCPPNEPSDRRFLQSAGKFTLLPGAVNFITTGVVWARTSSGGPTASIKLLKSADDKAQNLFESCFKILDGPDAPLLTIRELNKEIIISLINPKGSNNDGESYREKNSNIPINPNSYFTFEGYKVFQVKDPSVSINDLHNPDKARLLSQGQSDIQNGLSQIVNKYLDGDLNAYVPVEEVYGADRGLKHSFRITSDLFATGDPGLINHKTYYYLAVAYAYDSVADILDPFQPPAPGLYGQPYIQSRKNADGTGVSVYTAIPHISDPEAQGLVLTSAFGEGPEITRITGMGNGFIIGSDRATMDLKQDQVEDILFNQSNPSNKVLYPTYQKGRGPVDIRIYDPMKIPQAEFELWIDDTATQVGKWMLKNLWTGKIDTSTKTLEFPYDQLFTDYGFSISMNQVKAPGEYRVGGNGAIGMELNFENVGNNWLSFVPDIDNFPPLNWILAGAETTDYSDGDGALDGSAFYEKVFNGIWSPFILAARDGNGVDHITPAPFLSGQQAQEFDSLMYLGSVDVIITPDKSKWSRCVVFEMGNINAQNEGGQGRSLIRKHPSWNLDGTYSTTDSGFSYFPGYAINVETGERLNIAFGEDSHLASDNGADMIWNPTSSVFGDSLKLLLGGKHYIYVFGHKIPETPNNSQDTSYYGPAYDGCNFIYSKLWGLPALKNTTLAKNRVKYTWKDCMWVTCPILTQGKALLSGEIYTRLRVAKPYRLYDTGVQNSINNNFPLYRFSTIDLAPKVNQVEVAKSAMSLINVVPNPYYAYSNYESNQLDNRIKIVNLPPKCVISIYTTSGTLIRQFKRDAGGGVGYNNSAGAVYPEVNLESSVDWDLKNLAGVPIASGIYLIHVTAEGIGERTIKWFGVIRPIDLDTF